MGDLIPVVDEVMPQSGKKTKPETPLFDAQVQALGNMALPQNPSRIIRAVQEVLPDLFWTEG